MKWVLLKTLSFTITAFATTPISFEDSGIIVYISQRHLCPTRWLTFGRQWQPSIEGTIRHQRPTTLASKSAKCYQNYPRMSQARTRTYFTYRAPKVCQLMVFAQRLLAGRSSLGELRIEPGELISGRIDPGESIRAN